MQKEKLSIENIKTDLHFEIKKGYKELAGFSSLFLVMLGLVLAVFKFDISDFVFHFLGLIVEVFLSYLIIRQLKNLTMLHENVKEMNCIVMDKLINAEYKDRHSRRTIGERYCLHFSQYGKYVIPAENYKWSSAFSMSDEDVYNHANNGDEFYLVLSSHKGKILYVYNTKIFEVE